MKPRSNSVKMSNPVCTTQKCLISMYSPMILLLTLSIHFMLTISQSSHNLPYLPHRLQRGFPSETEQLCHFLCELHNVVQSIDSITHVPVTQCDLTSCHNVSFLKLSLHNCCMSVAVTSIVLLPQFHYTKCQIACGIRRQTELKPSIQSNSVFMWTSNTNL